MDEIVDREKQLRQSFQGRISALYKPRPQEQRHPRIKPDTKSPGTFFSSIHPSAHRWPLVSLSDPQRKHLSPSGREAHDPRPSFRNPPLQTCIPLFVALGRSSNTLFGIARQVVSRDFAAKAVLAVHAETKSPTTTSIERKYISLSPISIPTLFFFLSPPMII